VCVIAPVVPTEPYQFSTLSSTPLRFVLARSTPRLLLAQSFLTPLPKRKLTHSLAGISLLAPNNHTLYIPLGTSEHKYFPWPGPGLGDTVPSEPNSSLATADPRPFVRSSQTPLRPLLTLDRSLGHGLSYPAGSDSTAIRRATYSRRAASSDGRRSASLLGPRFLFNPGARRSYPANRLYTA